MTKLVSIFGCGVQKGGTTSLHAHFCEHPMLSPPSRKEIHFFDDESHDWSAPNYGAIDAFFPPDDGDRLRFEITPIYIFWTPSIERILTYNPIAKLIFLFRDPFERAWSQWCMEYARGNETLPFAEAIREGRRRMGDLQPLAWERRIYSYIERGLYSGQVRRALTTFPRNQILFLRSQDLLNDHAETLNRISSFLGIAPDTGPKREFTRPSVSIWSLPTAADREFIANLAREDVREFSALTGLDVSDWPTMK